MTLHMRYSAVLGRPCEVYMLAAKTLCKVSNAARSVMTAAFTIEQGVFVVVEAGSMFSFPSKLFVLHDRARVHVAMRPRHKKMACFPLLWLA